MGEDELDSGDENMDCSPHYDKHRYENENEEKKVCTTKKTISAILDRPSVILDDSSDTEESDDEFKEEDKTKKDKNENEEKKEKEKKEKKEKKQKKEKKLKKEKKEKKEKIKIDSDESE